MKKVVLIALLAVMALLVIGCSSTKEVKKEELPPPPPPTPVVKKATDPDITFKIASIDLGKLARRIELKDIDGLAGELKKQKIDILTLQGVSRYPEVATRIDIIDSLSSRTDMRKIFGETIELSGRQTGNAILCSYPVRSNENTHYDGLHSDNFEAALQGVIDCGARDVIIVSTGLPDTMSEDDKRTIANKMSSFGIQYLNIPMIITGNLPTPDELRTSAQYAALKPMSFDDAPRIWFSTGGALKLIGQSISSTIVGSMTVAEFGLFRKPQP